MAIASLTSMAINLLPLAAMMIMKEESEEITKYLYSQLLPSGGANCHFPLVYCHAPLAFFGLNLLQRQCQHTVYRASKMGAGAGHCRLTLADILTSHWNRLNCLKVRIGTPILKASYDDYGFLLMFSWVKQVAMAILVGA